MRTSPEGTNSVNVDDLVPDAVRSAVVCDRFLAAVDHSVVVDDAVAARHQLGYSGSRA
jgi:hypothetical protein